MRKRLMEYPYRQDIPQAFLLLLISAERGHLHYRQQETLPQKR